MEINVNPEPLLCMLGNFACFFFKLLIFVLVQFFSYVGTIFCLPGLNQ